LNLSRISVSLFIVGVLVAGFKQGLGAEAPYALFQTTSTYTTFSTIISTSYQYRTSTLFKTFTTITRFTQKETSGPYLKIEIVKISVDLARDPTYGFLYNIVTIYLRVANLLDVPVERGMAINFGVTKGFSPYPWGETANIALYFDKPIGPKEAVSIEGKNRVAEGFDNVFFKSVEVTCGIVDKNPIATRTYSEDYTSTIVRSYVTSTIMFTIGATETVLILLMLGGIAVVIVTFLVRRVKHRPQRTLL